MAICPWNQAAAPACAQATEAVVAAQGAGDWGQAAAPASAHYPDQQPQSAQPPPSSITKDAVHRMYHVDTTPGSVMQVLDIKKIFGGNSGQAAERFKLVVSDGQR